MHSMQTLPCIYFYWYVDAYVSIAQAYEHGDHNAKEQYQCQRAEEDAPGYTLGSG